MEGNGISELGAAEEHMKNAVLHGAEIREFYGDGAFDVNDLFNVVHTIDTRPIIKIRGNASIDCYRGTKQRRSAVREYKEKGYKKWASENNYGMRWPGN